MVTTRSQARKQRRNVGKQRHTGYYYIGKQAPACDEEARDASAFLRQLWQLPPTTQYIPVPNPVSMLRRDLQRLQAQAYFVSAKLDGVRFLLLMGATEGDHKPYNYMIDRACHMYKVEAQIEDADQYRMGTLIDGELVQDREGRLHYIGFDVVASRGQDCSSWRYEVRMQHLRGIMDTLKLEGCTGCAAKQCVPMHDILRLLRDMVDSPYPSDGLIFMPDRCPVRTGMHRDMFKWKTQHTIDFQLVREQGEPALLYSCSDGLHPCSELKIELLRDHTLDGLLEQELPCIVECVCTYTPSGAIRARIISSRPDKTCPNYERTVILTLQNIRESISRDELVGSILVQGHD